MQTSEETRLQCLQRRITQAYDGLPQQEGGGLSFGELLCFEIHCRKRPGTRDKGLTFCWLAKKWGITLSTLGELIHEHCRALEALPRVRHDYNGPKD